MAVGMGTVPFTSYLAIRVASSLAAGVWSCPSVWTQCPSASSAPRLEAGREHVTLSASAGFPAGRCGGGCHLDSLAVAVAKLTPHHELSCEESQTCLNYNLLVGPREGLECRPQIPSHNKHICPNRFLF